MNEPRAIAPAMRKTAVPGKAVVDPAAWTDTDLAQSDDWVYRLTEAEIDDLLSMARSVRERIEDQPNGLLQTGRDDFDLGTFGPRLAAIRGDLKDGSGVALIRGLPLDDITPVEAAIVYWGLGRHLGSAVSNNPDGDMIGHVTDLGGDYNAPTQRGYQTRASMDFHCDQCDIVGLLCIHTAKSGGLSKIASSVAVYNALLQRRPELIGVLTQPYCWSKHAEVASGEKGFYESPVFNFLDGNLCTSFGPKHIEKGHALPEAPDMTAVQLDAIRTTEDICEELHYAMELRRGDIQLLNNSPSCCIPGRNTRIGRSRNAKGCYGASGWWHPTCVRPTPYIEQWRNGVHVDGTEPRIVL